MNHIIKQLNGIIDKYKRQNKSYEEFVRENQDLVKEVVEYFFQDNWKLEIYYRSFKYFIRIGFQKAFYLIEKEICEKESIKDISLERLEYIKGAHKGISNELEIEYIKLIIATDEIDEQIISMLLGGYKKDEIARVLGVGRKTVYNRLNKMKAKLKMLYQY